NTNYCPKDEEVPKIRALLEPILQLKKLDDKIRSSRLTDSRRQSINWQHSRLDTSLSKHRALISPVPLDIIGEISFACLPTHRNCVMSASEAPLLLGRICRSTSLSTPRL
ncbi:hypothetical protein C8F04DRAFT_909864, partial [Mycena alexandri]